MVTTNSLIPIVVTIILVILILAVLLKLLKQPHVIGYIIAGILLGPFGFKLVTDSSIVSLLGEIGVIILLFFIGMEVEIKKIISNWKVAVYGTFFQILFSVLFTYILSFWLDWSFNRILLIGFVISLSSTAVVLKILSERNELETKVGQNSLSILLIQDIAVIFMLIIISLLGSKEVIDFKSIGLQLFGTIFFIGIIIFAIKKGNSLKLPLPKIVKKDKELQIFLALIMCFGFAYIAEFFHLSSALGAFIAGILVSLGKETDWVSSHMHSFYVIFVAIFFVSIGMLIDIFFIYENFLLILFLIVGVFITNTFINAVILKILKNSWIESLYAGALLSAIGEFSFILGSVAFNDGIITEYTYKLVVSIIALTLLLSPMWISFFKYILEFFEKKNHVHYLKKIKISKDRIKKIN